MGITSNPDPLAVTAINKTDIVHSGGRTPAIGDIITFSNHTVKPHAVYIYIIEAITSTQYVVYLAGHLDNGEDGADGLAATIEIQSTTTTEPGTKAEVFNVGNANAAKLKFYIRCPKREQWGGICGSKKRMSWNAFSYESTNLCFANKCGCPSELFFAEHVINFIK